MGSILSEDLTQQKQNYRDSIIDYHSRALIIYKSYTLIPNNLESHVPYAQQWTPTSDCVHGGFKHLGNQRDYHSQLRQSERSACVS